LNPDVKQFESETFDAEREMSGILGYDVKLFHQVNKLIFLSPKELQQWFEEEIDKEQPNWDLIKILESQHGIEFDYKDLHWTAQNDSVGLAKYWIDKGVDMDAKDKYYWTPLSIAARENSEEVAKLLIDAGADKEAKDEDLRTPLHYAASKNSEAVAKLLIDAGADKEAKNRDLHTPLHFAAIYDSEAVAKHLIDAGVDKEARNKYLSTPLHLAANYDRISVAKLLLDAGLDRGAKNEHNLTPWDLASSEIRQSLPELNPDFKQFESENFNAEQEMSDILGYDVKLFNQVSKLLFFRA
jgi:ankyrin repeat protein